MYVVFVNMVKAACFGYAGYGLYFAGSHGICLNQYKKYRIQLYDDNKEPVEVSAELKSIEEEVKNNWRIRNRRKLKVVIGRGIDIMQRGYLALKFGVAIGLPLTCNYRSVEDVPDWDHLLKTLYNIDNVYHEDIDNGCSKNNNNVFSDENIDNVYNKDVEDLKNSLILSDKAKKFVLARQIYLAQTHHPFNTMVLMLSSAYLFYCYLYYSEKNLWWTRKFKLGFRLATATTVAFVMFQMYWFLKGKYSQLIDRWTDDKAMILGKEYAEGGIEFYDKLIQRNITLRNLSKSGYQLYTASGDVQNRFPYVPLSERKESIEKYLSDLNS